MAEANQNFLSCLRWKYLYLRHDLVLIMRFYEMFYLPIASEVSYQIISVELISLQNIIIIIVTILPTHRNTNHYRAREIKIENYSLQVCQICNVLLNFSWYVKNELKILYLIQIIGSCRWWFHDDTYYLFKYWNKWQTPVRWETNNITSRSTTVSISSSAVY